MELLLHKGAVVDYNAPFIPRLPSMRHFSCLRMSSQELTAGYPRTRDCVLIATGHSTYDWKWIALRAPLIIDTRTAMKDVIARRATLRGWATGRSHS